MRIATRRPFTFTTVNVNVKSNPTMPQRSVVHDVKRASQTGSLIGWNEIGPGRYFDALKQLGPEWGHYMPHDGKLHIPNPISWKKSEWKLEDSGFLRTHHGLAKVSPNRYITWVKLKHRDSGQELVRVNTHLVSGAWSTPKPTTPWRRHQWRVHMEKLAHLVDRFESKGLKVIIGGDFNRDSYRVLGKRVRYDNDLHVGTHGRSTLDYLMHTRNPDLRRVAGRVQQGYASDHDAVVARYALRGFRRRVTAGGVAR
ncbi:MAG: endonuclease/exonuclease/phosphatase family protein [Myxococcota bacterium]